LAGKRLRSIVLPLMNMKMISCLFISTQHAYAEWRPYGNASPKERPTDALSISRSNRFGQEQAQPKTRHKAQHTNYGEVR
jgi:hypothetical protein